MATVTKYYKVVGSELLDDGATVRHKLKPVTDFTGATFSGDVMPDIYDTPAAQEQPRGTIVKVVVNTTRQLTLNPTS
jgi:hypothetical protein